MSDYITTVSDSFPVKDITHKPKRMQGDMIRAKENIDVVTTDSDDVAEDTLSIITLERAINYYKKKSADKTNGKLYSATANWLEELLITRTLKTEAAVKAVKESSNGEAE